MINIKSDDLITFINHESPALRLTMATFAVF